MKKTVMSKVMGVAMSTIMAAAAQQQVKRQRRQYRNQLQVHRAMIMEQ